MSDSFTIGSAVRKPSQLTPFSRDDFRPIESMGIARGIVGGFFEELTEKRTGAVRLRTDSRATICPDLFDERRGAYYEVKAVGNSGRCIFYEHRVSKEKRLQNRGYLLFYFVWRHTTSAKSCIGKSFSELRASLLATTRELVVISYNKLSEYLWSLPTKTLNTSLILSGKNVGEKNGYGGKGYGIGWGINYTALRELAIACYEFPEGQDPASYNSPCCYVPR